MLVRRRRTDVTSVWASVAAARTARMATSASWRPPIESRLSRSLGRCAIRVGRGSSASRMCTNSRSSVFSEPSLRRKTFCLASGTSAVELGVGHQDARAELANVAERWEHRGADDLHADGARADPSGHRVADLGVDVLERPVPDHQLPDLPWRAPRSHRRPEPTFHQVQRHGVGAVSFEIDLHDRARGCALDVGVVLQRRDHETADVRQGRGAGLDVPRPPVERGRIEDALQAGPEAEGGHQQPDSECEADDRALHRHRGGSSPGREGEADADRRRRSRAAA